MGGQKKTAIHHRYRTTHLVASFSVRQLFSTGNELEPLAPCGACSSVADFRSVGRALHVHFVGLVVEGLDRHCANDRDLPQRRRNFDGGAILVLG